MDYEADGRASSAEEFANFNFAQAVAKILDNLGFSSTTADALELLTSMMRRYFEDLCQRIAANKDLGGRQLPTLGDIEMAFKTQNVSLVELNDYMRQVQKLPLPPQIPNYPIKQFDKTEPDTFQVRIFHADPFADEVPSLEEIEERYGKEKQQENEKEAQTSGGSDELANRMEMSEATNKVAVIEEDSKEAFAAWNLPDNAELPNFSGCSAKDLGFDMGLYRRKFAEFEHKKHKSGGNGVAKTSNTTLKLFDRLVPNTIGSSISMKIDGLNKLVEKIKKRKKHKDKDRNKDRKKDKKDKKHREPAPKLTPAVPLPSLDPDSGIGDSLKINLGSVPKAEQKETTNGAPNQTENIKPPVEPPKIHEPIKVKAQNLSPPPTLEQAVPKVTVADDKPPTVPSTNLTKSDETKKEKRHKKEKKKKKDKEESRKRKHDEISSALPPVLKPSVSQESAAPLPALPATTEADSTKEPVTAVIQQRSVDKTSTSTAGVRLKIRIGSTLSSDSMKSSPVEATTSKPSSAGITPPTVIKEAKEEPVTEQPVSVVDPDEPPPKKHKKEKKHKKDKDREMQFETEEQKAEYERQRKERKEKKHREKTNGHSNNNKPSTSDQPKATVNESAKKEEPVPLVHEPLKLKLNKNGLEQQASTEKEQQVNEILSVIKESQEKKEHSEKPESKEKDKSHKKKHKKEKKHRKDRESRPASSLSDKVGELSEKPKPKEPPKMLNQFARPTSQNSTIPKLFDPTPFKPEVKREKSATSKSDQNVSSSSSTSSKTEKKEPGKKKMGKSGKESDQVWVCPVCSIAYVDGAVDMVGCDSCNNWFHFACVGMLRPPPDNVDWHCQKCVEAKRKKLKGRKK